MLPPYSGRFGRFGVRMIANGSSLCCRKYFDDHIAVVIH